MRLSVCAVCLSVHFVKCHKGWQDCYIIGGHSYRRTSNS